MGQYYFVRWWLSSCVTRPAGEPSAWAADTARRASTEGHLVITIIKRPFRDKTGLCLRTDPLPATQPNKNKHASLTKKNI